jgi:transposase
MGTSKKCHIQGRKGSRFREQIRGVDLERVLNIAIDAAKLHQRALICNYFGDVIEAPFFFSVNKEGIQELLSKIQNAQSGIEAQRTFM